jgi:hypothetical protein
MNTKINFYVKSVYGTDMMYVADQKQAQLIKGLTGQKTLTNQVMTSLQALGFTFEQVMQPINQ